MKKILTLSIFVFICSMSIHFMVFAGEDHSEFFDTEFLSPTEVTEACLECHQEAGEDFIKTAHWLWKGKTPFVKQHETDRDIGKINLMNGY